MRLGILIIALFVTRTTFAADNADFCEQTWPKQKRPKSSDSIRCSDFFREKYLNHPDRPDGDIMWQLSADTWTAMADAVQAACASWCDVETDESIQFFREVARAHFTLQDDVAKASFEPVLAKMLRGERLQAKDLESWSKLTLWRLRNAPYARHGRPFKTQDLQTFFYGNRGKDAGATPLLPLVQDPAYKDSLLDKTDQANVALVVKAQEL